MQHLIVTTSNGGVFFGEGEISKETILTLKNIRMAIYWDAAVKGVIGLAVDGPSSGSRITKAAPSMLLHNVTGVMVPTEAAIKAWNEAPWATE